MCVRTGDAECGDEELREALHTALNTKEYADKVAAQLYHEQVRARAEGKGSLQQQGGLAGGHSIIASAAMRWHILMKCASTGAVDARKLIGHLVESA